jgi:hypothetical protein
MCDCNNQCDLSFEEVDNAKGKASEDYPASTQYVWTAVVRKCGNTCHRSLDRCDEVLTEARGCSLVVADRSEKFLAGGW